MEDTISSTKKLDDLGSREEQQEDEAEKENEGRRIKAFHIRSEPSLDIETGSRAGDEDVPVRLCTTQRTEMETAMTAREEVRRIPLKEKMKSLGRKLLR